MFHELKCLINLLFKISTQYIESTDVLQLVHLYNNKTEPLLLATLYANKFGFMIVNTKSAAVLK